MDPVSWNLNTIYKQISTKRQALESPHAPLRRTQQGLSQEDAEDVYILDL